MRPLHRGFTVIELLITMFVLGLLMALLLPVLPRARQSGRRAALLNNTRLQTAALINYASDNDG